MKNKNRVPFDSVSFSIWLISSLLGKTWRITLSSSLCPDPFNDKGAGRIYCFWHSQLLTLSYIFRNTDKAALVSKSTDGLRAAAVAQKWNYDIIFGSSSRGAMTAMRQCFRVLGKKQNIAITPDGPRGPKEVIKPGVAQLSIVSGSPVIPVAVFPKSYWRLNSWDRFLIPKPFTRIKTKIGDPIRPQSVSGDDKVDKLCNLIQERMDAGFKLAD